MVRALSILLLASGCNLYFGGGDLGAPNGDDTNAGCEGYECYNTCGVQPTADATCTPGDSCDYEDWEHGCTCSCDEDGHWACFNETIGSHCPTGAYSDFDYPVKLEVVNSGLDERAPALAPDGSELVFARPGPGGDLDLWRAQALSDGSFAKPVRDAELSRSPGDDSDPSLAADGTLYFSRSGDTLAVPPGGAPARVPELAGVTGADVSRPGDLALVGARGGAVIEFTRPGAATPWTQVGTVDQMGIDGAPCMRNDGHELIFEGVRDGKRALFVATRWERDQPWQVVAPLFVYGMDGANVVDPELSADGLTLVFASDVGGDFDLYAMRRYRL